MEDEPLFSAITEHLLQDAKPSVYLQTISQTPNFQKDPFRMLFRLKQTEQSKQYHPEGNVWNHTMLVIDEGAKVRKKSRDDIAFMWACLLHDIGKPDTTRIRRGKITSYDHDKAGEKLTKEFLGHFPCQPDFVLKVAGLVRFHMHLLYVIRDLPFSDVPAMLRQTDIREVALLGFCDHMGRLNPDRAREEKNRQIFLKKCLQVTKR